MKKAVRTVLWRILVFYIGAIFVIAAVVPVDSEGLKSPFATVLEASGMPGAATAITLVAVAALLSALNANLYGASRMAFIGEDSRPQLLSTFGLVALLAAGTGGLHPLLVLRTTTSRQCSSTKQKFWNHIAYSRNTEESV